MEVEKQKSTPTSKPVSQTFGQVSAKEAMQKAFGSQIATKELQKVAQIPIPAKPYSQSAGNTPVAAQPAKPATTTPTKPVVAPTAAAPTKPAVAPAATKTATTPGKPAVGGGDQSAKAMETESKEEKKDEEMEQGSDDDIDPKDPRAPKYKRLGNVCECSTGLKEMKNTKSPGLDGITYIVKSGNIARPFMLPTLHSEPV